jgi:hypothetical protein
MTTERAQALIAEVISLGFKLSITGDKLSVRYPCDPATGNRVEPPPGLLDQLRQEKPAVIAILRQQTASGATPGEGGESSIADINLLIQRSGCLPPSAEPIPFADEKDPLTRDEISLIGTHFWKQSAEVMAWVFDRANGYRERHPDWSAGRLGVTGAIDLLLWRLKEAARVPSPERSSRCVRIKAGVELLESIEEADRYFNSHSVGKTNDNTFPDRHVAKCRG